MIEDAYRPSTSRCDGSLKMLAIFGKDETSSIDKVHMLVKLRGLDATVYTQSFPTDEAHSSDFLAALLITLMPLLCNRANGCLFAAAL